MFIPYKLYLSLPGNDGIESASQPNTAFPFVKVAKKAVQVKPLNLSNVNEIVHLYPM